MQTNYLSFHAIYFTYVRRFYSDLSNKNTSLQTRMKFTIIHLNIQQYCVQLFQKKRMSEILTIILPHYQLSLKVIKIMVYLYISKYFILLEFLQTSPILSYRYQLIFLGILVFFKKTSYLKHNINHTRQWWIHVCPKTLMKTHWSKDSNLGQDRTSSIQSTAHQQHFRYTFILVIKFGKHHKETKNVDK